MIIFRYLFAETVKSQIAVLFILSLIFVSQQFVALLSKVMTGALPANLVMEMLLYTMPALGTLILPVSLFIGILFAHGRLYAESEMVILTACGYTPSRILMSSLLLSSVTIGLVAFNAFIYAPTAEEGRVQLLENVDADVGLATLKQGRFESLDGGLAVVYVESYDSDKSLRKIFIAKSPSQEGERPSIVLADKGNVESDDNGSQWLKLSQGLRYEGEFSQRDFRIVDFSEYRVFIQEQDVSERGRKTKALPTSALWNSNEFEHKVELQWRIAQVVAIPLLTLLVVPLAMVNPRQGRYAKLFPALLMFLTYFMLLSAARSAILDEKLPLAFGFWSVHLGVLTLAIWFNLANFSWYHRLVQKMKVRFYRGNSSD
ncbi:LPS export ABC transporter permease LptF [Moritella sp.]|uniref:LPS export ABC transporter permease LptF n=1 Tax=Moritella sp. TaxID=78556 RepID=UPI001D3FE484|nr:LPS export ABC transporter permease LptF [Moritella sp.]MCJ8350854.1 LPS export ABC transporter permease LptF [Moritella sp.]NQZ40458.1 LPS export ABC transporter permease LptF [Moritella sp.]